MPSTLGGGAGGMSLGGTGAFATATTTNTNANCKVGAIPPEDSDSSAAKYNHASPRRLPMQLPVHLQQLQQKLPCPRSAKVHEWIKWARQRKRVTSLIVLICVLILVYTINLRYIAKFKVTNEEAEARRHQERMDEADRQRLLRLMENMTVADTIVRAKDVGVSRDKGIILSLHNNIVAMGVSLIKELRCHGNQELIQVYHCFPDELTEENRELLLAGETRVELVDVCAYYVKKNEMSMRVAHRFRNWWIKPLALFHTDVRHAMMVDADVMLLRDPAPIRELERYKSTGTMFFYDRVMDTKMFFAKQIDSTSPTATKKKMSVLEDLLTTFDYETYGLTGYKPSRSLLQSYAWNSSTSHEQDSSMLFVDKTKAHKPLQILWYLITERRFDKRREFSHGDKETFWLSYELSHQEYSFSPWGVSVISSSTNRDMERHNDTLCGNMAHWMPVDEPDQKPELLYVNGKAILEPFPLGVGDSVNAPLNIVFNPNPTHVTPRQKRRGVAPPQDPSQTYEEECLVGLGSTPLPEHFKWHLLRRRTYYFGLKMNVTEPLKHCKMF